MYLKCWHAEDCLTEFLKGSAALLTRAPLISPIKEVSYGLSQRKAGVFQFHILIHSYVLTLSPCDHFSVLCQDIPECPLSGHSRIDHYCVCPSNGIKTGPRGPCQELNSESWESALVTINFSPSSLMTHSCGPLPPVPIVTPRILWTAEPNSMLKS